MRWSVMRWSVTSLSLHQIPLHITQRQIIRDLGSLHGLNRHTYID